MHGRGKNAGRTARPFGPEGLCRESHWCSSRPVESGIGEHRSPYGIVERYRVDLNRAQRRNRHACRDHAELTRALDRLEAALDEASARDRALRDQAAALGIPGPLSRELDDLDLLVESLDDYADELLEELEHSTDDVAWLADVRLFVDEVRLALARLATSAADRAWRARRRPHSDRLHQPRPPAGPKAPHAPPVTPRGIEGAPHAVNVGALGTDRTEGPLTAT